MANHGQQLQTSYRGSLYHNPHMHGLFYVLWFPTNFPQTIHQEPRPLLLSPCSCQFTSLSPCRN